MTAPRAMRVDDRGRAFAGSQKWIQYFVNWRRNDLNDAIRAALPSLPGAPLWVSPLAHDQYREYRDDAFLAATGLGQHTARLRGFWPRGGPCWDALARSGEGVVLVEAKSYPGELFGGGCQAGPHSRPRIEKSLNATKAFLGADPAADWTGQLYQSANRLAHLHFFREIVQVPAWLVHVCFVDDPRTPTSESQWRTALRQASAGLGLRRPSEFSAAVFLKAQGPPDATPNIGETTRPAAIRRP